MLFRSVVFGVGLVALMAACAPQSPESDAGRDPCREPAGLENGAFEAELDGVSIHYEVHGQGPVLMTVPNSWGLTLEGLRGFYRPLEEQLTLVYFDPRGMGRSGSIRDQADMGLAAVRADFHALREHLGLERVNAIGWSNGAMNLILLAAEKPELLCSAIFLHGAASFTEEDGKAMEKDHPELFEQYGAFQKEMQQTDMTQAERDARVKEFFVEVSFPRSLANSETDLPKLVELYRDVGFSWAHARHAQEESPTFDARDRLPGITTRSLIIAGAHDMFPVAKAEEMQAGLPNAELVVLPGSGHFAPVEEPAAFQSAVLEFLEGEQVR